MNIDSQTFLTSSQKHLGRCDWLKDISFLVGVNGEDDLVLDLLRLLAHFKRFVVRAEHMSDQLFYVYPYFKENLATFYACRVIF